MTLRNLQVGDEVQVGPAQGSIQEILEGDIAIIDTGFGTFEAPLADCQRVRQDDDEEEED